MLQTGKNSGYPTFLLPYIECAMLAKKTSKNQITLPKAVISRFPGVEYFEVTEEDGRIVLRPAQLNRADAVRAKLEALGITEQDVTKAIQGSRANCKRTKTPDVFGSSLCPIASYLIPTRFCPPCSSPRPACVVTRPLAITAHDPACVQRYCRRIVAGAVLPEVSTFPR